jgi:hypothetical protein
MNDDALQNITEHVLDIIKLCSSDNLLLDVKLIDTADEINDLMLSLTDKVNPILKTPGCTFYYEAISVKIGLLQIDQDNI